jgi:hypothetical protein
MVNVGPFIKWIIPVPINNVSNNWWLRGLGYDILHIVFWRPDSGQRVFRFVGVREGFSGRKPRVLTPMAVMPAGIVTLLGAPLWVPFVQGLRVKTLNRWSRQRWCSASLPSWGRRRGVLFPSVAIQCHWWQILVFLFFVVYLWSAL